MKARFTEEQPALSWKPLDNGMVDVAICLNGAQVEETYTNQADDKQTVITTTQTMWEYDFHQFREKAENLSRETVAANPEMYLDYEPEKKKSLEETVQEQATTIQMLTECLLEVSEMIYA